MKRAQAKCVHKDIMRFSRVEISIVILREDSYSIICFTVESRIQSLISLSFLDYK